MAKRRPEKKLENEICYWLNFAGWSTDHCQSDNRPGWSDITALQGCRAILTEVKDKTEIRDSQRIFAMHQWLTHNVIVWHIYPSGQFLALSPVFLGLPAMETYFPVFALSVKDIVAQLLSDIEFWTKI